MSQLKNIADLSETISKIISKLTLGKFIIWVIVILGISTISFYVYNNILDNSSYYYQIDQRLKTINKISQLPYKDSAIQKKSIEQITFILEDLNQQPITEDVNLVGRIAKPLSNNYIRKLLISSILPVLLGFIVFYTNNRDKDVLVGLLFVLPILILLSSLIPLFSGSFIIYSVIIAATQISVFILFSYLGTDK